MKLLNKNRATSPTPERDNCTAASDLDKATLLNTFFASCWNSQKTHVLVLVLTCQPLRSLLRSFLHFNPSHYRPVSLLSIVSRLLERIVYCIVWDHMLNHSPLSDCQWGFQKGKSTTTALLSTIHDWYSLLDKRNDILCVFFDFKKAFDSVSYLKLMEKN